MLRTILEFVAYLLVFLALRAFLRGAFRRSGQAPQPRMDSRPQSTAVPSGGELKKDPVCGTYVSTTASLSRKVGSETFYFCSAECRDRYKG